MRAAMGNKNFDFVAVNDITDTKTLAHLLKYDSILGNLDAAIEAGDGWISVNGDKFRCCLRRTPPSSPGRNWHRRGLRGYRQVHQARRRRQAHHRRAKRVVITAPATAPDATFVMGVNNEQYDPAKHVIVSNASCTTNCLAPFAKVLQDSFGIKKGWMTTIHSYTNDQNVLDFPHKDLRRARAAALSMIPTTTGAAKAVGEVLPALKGKLDGFSMARPDARTSRSSTSRRFSAGRRRATR